MPDTTWIETPAGSSEIREWWSQEKDEHTAEKLPQSTGTDIDMVHLNPLFWFALLMFPYLMIVLHRCCVRVEHRHCLLAFKGLSDTDRLCSVLLHHNTTDLVWPRILYSMHPDCDGGLRGYLSFFDICSEDCNLRASADECVEFEGMSSTWSLQPCAGTVPQGTGECPSPENDGKMTYNQR